MSNIDISGGGGGGTWGSITGTLSDQTDLQTALDGKVNDTGDETIAGVKTFSSAPIMSALTASKLVLTDGSKALSSSSYGVSDLVLTSTDQTIAGAKTFSGHLTIGGGATASELRLLEPSGSGSNYTAFKAQAQAADLTYTLPASITNNGFLKVVTGGTTSWETVSVSPAGSSGEFQYNDSSSFGGSTYFTYTKATGVLSLVPTGSPTTLFDFDMSGLTTWTNGIKFTGAFPASASGQVVYLNPTGTTSSSRTHIGYRFGMNTGSYTTSTVAAHYVTLSSTNTGNVLGNGYSGSSAGNYGFYSTVSNGSNVGSVTAVLGVAYGTKTNIGGDFYGVAGTGSGVTSWGVRANASQDGSAQAVGILSRISTATSSSHEQYNPGISASALFSNGDTTAAILVLRDLDTTVMSMADGGTATIGASGGTQTHVVNGSMTVSKTLTPVKFVSTVSTLTDAATVSLDASLGNIFTLSAGGDRTIDIPTNATSGQKIIIRILASGGARTISLTTGSSGAFRFGTDVTGTSTTSSGKIDYIGCIYNGTDSRWDVVSYVKGF